MPQPSLTAFPRLGAFALAMSLLGGCSKSYIPNTDVEDTSENRRVIKFCEEYRHAVEEKDVGKILGMVSPRYFEDGGNAKDEDDIDVEGLKQFLAGDFGKVQGIRYEIRYRRVDFLPTKRIHVDYTYSASWRIPGVKSDEWKHAVQENRLELLPEGEGFKVAAGM